MLRRCRSAKAHDLEREATQAREIRQWVIEIAKTLGFGYTRIIGELCKLRIRKISRPTVRNILKEKGIEPYPDQTSDKGEHSFARHAETLWASDFFSVRTVTAHGIREMYLLVFLCLETRKLIASPEHPNSKWICAQTQDFLDQTANRSEKNPAIVIRDRDTKFASDFVKTLKSGGARNNVLPKANPNLKGRVERVILTIPSECLDKFVFVGKQHFDYIVGSFTAYYHARRAHSSRKSLPPMGSLSEEVASLKRGQMQIKSYVNGLIKSFDRKTA